MDESDLKKEAACRAVDDHVRSGMHIGLGTGSTSIFAVEHVGELLANGTLEGITCVPTSERTRRQAEGLGIPLTTLDELQDPLDVVIDGADTVDHDLNLVKGGGGALLREKLVETRSKKFVVIADDSKMSPDGLGKHFPIPVEIVPFCHLSTIRAIEALPSVRAAGANAMLRVGDVSNNHIDGEEVAVTDNANYIVDLHCKRPLEDPSVTARELLNIVGVVEHGLFCGMAHSVVIASKNGVRIMEAPSADDDDDADGADGAGRVPGAQSAAAEGKGDDADGTDVL